METLILILFTICIIGGFVFLIWEDGKKTIDVPNYMGNVLPTDYYKEKVL